MPKIKEKTRTETVQGLTVRMTFAPMNNMEAARRVWDLLKEMSGKRTA